MNIDLLAPLRPYIAIGALVASAAGLWWLHGHWYEAGASAVRAERDAERAAQAQAALSAERDSRAREHEIQQTQAEANNEATRQANHLVSARAAADAASQRLLNANRAAPSGGGRCQDAAAVATSPPASAPVDLRSDVLGRLDGAATELAEFAERATIAGTACERSYDALTSEH